MSDAQDAWTQVQQPQQPLLASVGLGSKGMSSRTQDVLLARAHEKRLLS